MHRASVTRKVEELGLPLQAVHVCTMRCRVSAHCRRWSREMDTTCLHVNRAFVRFLQRRTRIPDEPSGNHVSVHSSSRKVDNAKWCVDETKTDAVILAEGVVVPAGWCCLPGARHCQACHPSIRQPHRQTAPYSGCEESSGSCAIPCAGRQANEYPLFAYDYCPVAGR